VGTRIGGIAGPTSAAVLTAIVVVSGYLLFSPLTLPPDYVCTSPDPAPLPGINSATVLQECATGKTFAIHRGQTVAVDLRYEHAVDSGSVWSDFSVSDPSVLGIASGPENLGTWPRTDEVSTYVGLRSGASDISAYFYSCSVGCDVGKRWRVIVRVD
jgi:hypothetical protein